MPRDLEEKYNKLADAVRESTGQDLSLVLNQVLNYVRSIRQDKQIRSFVESRLSESAISHYEMLYHNIIAKGPELIIKEWKSSDEIFKPGQLVGGYVAMFEFIQDSLKDFRGDELKTRLVIHVSKSCNLYSEETPHDIWYEPNKNSVSWHIMKLLRSNTKVPVSASFIAKNIKHKSIPISSEIRSRIREINKAFKKAGETECPIIKSRHGYFLNDKDFEIVID